MTEAKRQKIIGLLQSQTTRSREFVQALQDADIRTIADAIEEIVLRPKRLGVNRTRFKYLLEHIVVVVTRPPTMELAGKGEKP